MVLLRRWMWATPARLERKIPNGLRIRMTSSLRMSCIGYHKLSVPTNTLLLRSIRCGTTPVLPINRCQSKSVVSECFLYRSASSYPGYPPSLNGGSYLSDEGISSSSLIDREIDQDTDELLSHLRINLYSVDEDPCGTLLKIYESASVQEVFDIIEGAPEVNLKFSSQALVTLWDMQKLLFKLGPLFNPEKDFVNKAEFINSLRNHPSFVEKILRPVVENHKELKDEPLCASLMCLKRMNYPLLEFEPLIEECIRRKDTLELAGLSRLSVTLRSENLYGNYVMANFMPLTVKYIENMTSDVDVRLVSIMLKGTAKFLTENIIHKYVSRVSRFIESKQYFDTVTYCKMFLVLMDMGKEAYPMLRIIGTLLASRVPEMELMEVLSLQKFLLSPFQEPYLLVEALMKKNLRLIEEDDRNPRLDSLSCVAPYLKNIQHRKKLSASVKLYMDKSDFDSAIHVLFTILKSIRTNDRELYDQYWNNVLTSLENSQDPRRVISFAKNYLNFTHSLIGSYRNKWFESVIKKFMYTYLNDYMKDLPGLFSPSDFAATIAFLIAFDQFFVDVEYLSKLSDFAPQLKAVDLYFIGKGVDSAMINVFKKKRVRSKNYETMIQICSILEEESALRLLQESKNHSNIELLTISRLSTIFTKVKGDSPLFDMSIRKVIQNGMHDSKEVRETCHVLSSGNYYCPIAMEKISEFLLKNLDYVSPETVERFLLLSYALGWEKYDIPFEKFAAVLETHWDKLGLGLIQSALALAFHHHLTPTLVRNIFTVEFLDQIDEELSSSFGNSSFYPMKLRVSLMELNRTICLDMPDSNLPWFHDKFCENVLSQGRTRENYLQTEVANILNQLLGESAVLSSVCSQKDYYYPIDFVIEFDESNRPIRRKRKNYFFGEVKDHSDKISRKVAILILQSSAFTKNHRSLKGSYKLKQRHLEMLGYDVVKIDSHHWNSMYMSENLAKQNYLESRIFQ